MLSTLLAMFAASVALDAADLVGTLPGSVSVDNRGAANYTIQLMVPPRRQGVQPQLALTYNSQSGDGPLGVGFSISTGFPQAITRGRSILARDNEVRGVTFTADDQLYLEGKRLILTSSTNTHFKPGSTYRIEVDSFVTISASGADNNVDTFVMEDKEGMKYTFGKYSNTTDGFQSAGGETTGAAYAYALKRVEDRTGNFLSFTYADQGEGEHLLTKIDYTGGSESIDPQAYLSFTYEARTNVAQNYLAGRHVNSTKRLASIEGYIKVGSSDKLATKYSLAYEDAATAGRTHLKSITPAFANPQSANYDLQSAPGTVVTWGAAPTVLSAPGAAFEPSSSHTLRANWQGDFNGDGRSDVLFLEGTNYVVATPNGDGSWSSYTAPVGTWGVFGWGPGPVAVGDFNGDGKSDLVWHNYGTSNPAQNQGWYLALSTGTGFADRVPMSTKGGVVSYLDLENRGLPGSAVVVDLDGDGIDELIYQEMAVQSIAGFGLPPPIITIDGFESAYRWAENQMTGSAGTISVNTANGTLHWVQPILSGANITFTDTELPNLPLPDPGLGRGYTLQRCDLDGDGRSDLIATQNELDASDPYHPSVFLSMHALRNTGNGTFGFVETIGNFGQSYGGTDGSGGFRSLVGDINGDGLDDVLCFQATRYAGGQFDAQSGWRVALSKGDGHFDSTAFATLPAAISVDGSVVDTFIQRSGTVDVLVENFETTTETFQSVKGFDISAVLLLDRNADGRKDFAWYSPTKGWRCVLAKAGGFDTANPIALIDSSSDSTEYNVAGDFGWDVAAIDGQGNGAESILLLRRNSTIFELPEACAIAAAAHTDNHRIVDIANGLGAQTALIYAPISSDAIYTSGATVAYPIRESRRQVVVADLYRDNGGNFAGDERQHFSYQYSGNRVDLSGRGSLGFHAFVTLDQQTKLFKYQFLAQSFPMTGLTAREETYRYWEGPVEGAEANGTKAQFRILSSHDNTVVFDEVVKSKDDPTAWGTVWPYISRATEYRWEDSTTAHFTLNLASPSSQPEALFPRTKESGEYIKITAESLFDEETSVHTALPESFNSSDTTSTGANAVTGVMTFSTISGHLPRKITYGNLTTLTTDYGDDYGEKVVTSYHPASGGLTGLVKDVQTFVWGGGYGTSAAPEASPKKTFGYWIDGVVQTPLVETETIDADETDLDLTTTYSRDTRGRVYKTEIANTTATGLQTIGSYSTSSVPFKAGSETDYDFDATFDLPKTVQNAAPYLHATKIVYDPILGLPTNVTDPNAAETTTIYDALGRVTQVQDVLKSLQTDTTYSLDSSASVSPPTGVTGLALTSVYKVQVTATGQPTVTTYFDRLGRAIRVVKEGYASQTSTTDTAYNSLGQIVAVSNAYTSETTDTNKLWTKTTYDALGRVSTVTAPNGTVTSTTYNGRTTTVSVDADTLGGVNPEAQATTTLVDAKGRTVKVWNADNSPGTISATTGGSSTASLEFKLDGFGRMRETILKGQTQKITATYDALGRQATLTDPDKGAWTYTNNALGQVVSQKDANKAVTESAFDHLGRPQTRTTTQFGTGAPVEAASWFYYDVAATKGWIGSLAREEHALSNAPGYTDPGSTKYFYYDSKGRPEIVLTTIDGKWFYTHTKYDSVSRPATVRYYWRPAAHEAPGDYPYLWENFGFTYSYDDQSHVTQIADTAARVWWQAAATDGYDHLDRPVKIQKGSGHWTMRAYRASDGVLTSIKTGPAAGDTDIQNLGVTFDGLGNLRKRTSGDLTETLGYDSLNRLTSSTTQGDTTYEANGNIATKKSVAGADSDTYIYSTTKPHAVTSAFGYTMGYDANGNLETRTKGTEGNTDWQKWSLKWTGFDKPRWMAKTVGSVTTGSEFLYDAHRSRVAHLEFDAMSGGASSAPSHYTRKKLYAVGAAMEVDYVNTAATGAPVWQQKTVRLYVSAPEGTVGAVEIPSLNQGGTPETWVYHHDHLGSIESITRYGDASAVTARSASGQSGRYSEDAWGQRRDPATWNGTPSTSTYDLNTLTPRGFTGHEMMDGLELVNMNGRIYDPLLGRMLSADIVVQAPGNLQSYNRYSYVANNPLTFTDRSGFSIDDPNDNGLLRKSKANTAAGNNWKAMGYGLAALPKLAFDSTVHVFRNALPQSIAAAKQDLAAKNASGKLGGYETTVGRLALASVEVGTGAPSLVANVDRIPKIVSGFPGKITGDVKAAIKNPTVSNVANVAEDAAIVYGGVKLTQGLAGGIKGALASGESSVAAAQIANPVPQTVARVIPNGLKTTTLGAPSAPDVFVADAAQLKGLNAQQVATVLTIPESPTGFKVIEFPTPEGLATPINRTNPGFVGKGQTAGKASEFVVPNGPIPEKATITEVH